MKTTISLLLFLFFYQGLFCQTDTLNYNISILQIPSLGYQIKYELGNSMLIVTKHPMGKGKIDTLELINLSSSQISQINSAINNIDIVGLDTLYEVNVIDGTCWEFTFRSPSYQKKILFCMYSLDELDNLVNVINAMIINKQNRLIKTYID